MNHGTLCTGSVLEFRPVVVPLATAAPRSILTPGQRNIVPRSLASRIGASARTRPSAKAGMVTRRKTRQHRLGRRCAAAVTRTAIASSDSSRTEIPPSRSSDQPRSGRPAGQVGSIFKRTPTRRPYMHGKAMPAEKGRGLGDTAVLQLARPRPTSCLAFRALLRCTASLHVLRIDGGQLLSRRWVGTLLSFSRLGCRTTEPEAIG